MKILLIDPPLFRFLNESQPSPPLGLCYIASYLKKNGYCDVWVYNADHDVNIKTECNKAFKLETDKFSFYKKNITNDDHPIYNEIFDKIAEIQPDIIGISIKTAKFFVSKKIINIIKNNFPRITIVAGGPHVSSSWDHVLERSDVDICIVGEGEQTFLEVVRTIDEKKYDFKNIPGIAFKKDGRHFFTGHRQLISVLDDIPFPAKDAVLNYESLLPDQLGGLFSSRGCPFNCNFCDSRNTWTRSVRRRSAKNIVDEILYTKERFKTSFFSFSGYL